MIKKETKTVKDTINDILLQELKAIIYDHQGSAYIKFVNIAVGIEFLGACLDAFDFMDQRQSKARFDNALKKLFPNRYKNYTQEGSRIYFYTEFRCSFFHQFRPGSKIAITHRHESKREGTKHLEKSNGLLILVLEDFFDDFEKACLSCIKKFDAGKLSSKKLNENYISYISLKD